MSIQDEFLSADRNIGEELNDLAQKAYEALQRQDLEQSKSALGNYFSVIRYAHAYGRLSETELDDRMGDWSNGMIALSEAAPSFAFFTAYDALKMCSRNEHGLLPCDTMIANAVFVHINVNVMRAVYPHVIGGHTRQVNIGDVSITSHQPYTMEQAKIYLIPLIDVIIGSSQYQDSQSLQDCFFEALSNFEDLIHSIAVHPISAYDAVKRLKDWADKNDKQGALAFRMHELMEYVTYLPDGQGKWPDGQGLLMNELEVQAEELGAESQEWYSKEPVDISSAFAIKAGVAVELVAFHQKIEKAFKDQNYQETEDELLALFYQLGEDSEDVDEDFISEDLSSYSYFFASLQKLTLLSEAHAAHLAQTCIYSVEDDMVAVSETVMAKLYECALPVISFLDLPDSDYKQTAKELYKIILRRSSEFEDIAETEDIFGCAEDGYRVYLETISPEERYDEVAGLVLWLNEREVASPYLQDFVSDLMDRVETVAGKSGIVLEGDEPSIPVKAKVLQLAAIEPSPL